MMDIHQIRSSYLNALLDDFQAFEIPDGLMVWVPLFHSDGDGVSLTVKEHNGGWLITDDGSTSTALRAIGAATDSAAFTDAWRALSRPLGPYIPESREADPLEIRAWCTEEAIGRAMHQVALACIRAEGLSYMRESEARQHFSRTVRDRLALLLTKNNEAATKVGLESGPGSIQLRSGRSRHVNAVLRKGNDTLAAIQALAGRDAATREKSFEHAYTICSLADLSKDRLFAVIRDPDEWDTGILDEVGEVSTVVPWETSDDFDHQFEQIIQRQLQAI